MNIETGAKEGVRPPIVASTMFDFWTSRGAPLIFFGNSNRGFKFGVILELEGVKTKLRLNSTIIPWYRQNEAFLLVNVVPSGRGVGVPKYFSWMEARYVDITTIVMVTAD